MTKEETLKMLDEIAEFFWQQAHSLSIETPYNAGRAAGYLESMDFIDQLVDKQKRE